jgi:hypothetical protein
MAEEGLDKLVEGDKSGEKLIGKAKKLDPGAVEELARATRRKRSSSAARAECHFRRDLDPRRSTNRRNWRTPRS